MSKPEELTLTQLKEELLAIGIKVPSKRTKAHYVDLYYTHIVDKQDGGYSDDNVQVNTSSSKRSARILNRKHQTFPSIPERSDVETSHVSVGTEDKRTEVQAILKSVQTDITGNVDASVSTLLNEKSEKSEVDKKTSVGAEEAQKTKTTSLASEVDDLSNTEIRSRLKDLGQSVGPIGPATRKVYLKKLVKLLEGGDAVVETAAVETQGKTFSDEDEPVPMVAVTRSSSRRRTMQTLLDEPPIVALRRTSSSTTKRSMVSRFNSDISSSQPALSSATKRRPLRSSAITNQQSTTSIVTQKTVETRETVVEQKSDTSSNQKEETDSSENVTIKPERRWIPIWVQIIFTLLVVLFAYLVIRTLEKAPPHLTLPSDAADN